MIFSLQTFEKFHDLSILIIFSSASTEWFSMDRDYFDDPNK